MPDETSQTEKSWFSAISWKTAVILSVLAFVSGGTGGGALVATKGVAAAGVTQDQADVRYLSKEEARQWRDSRTKELEELKKDLRSDIEKNLKKETFEAYHENDVKRMERIEKLIEQGFNSQNR